MCIPGKNIFMLQEAKFSLFDKEYTEIRRQRLLQLVYNSSEVLSI